MKKGKERFEFYLDKLQTAFAKAKTKKNRHFGYSKTMPVRLYSCWKG
ncbi:MAG: hypothetical protein IPJ81_08030 [Chitinophagaceae bacterium]|nr:hypothetical protein [Chitinophagaceae bacterium]